MQLIACTHLLKGLGASESRIIWNLFKSLPTSQSALESRATCGRIGRQLGISDRMDELLLFAEKISDGVPPESFLPSKFWDLVCTLSESEEETLLATPPLIRVAARIFGQDQATLSTSTHARLLVAHLVGGVGDGLSTALAARTSQSRC